MKEGKKQYRVGDLAEYFGVSRDTIRLYDKVGILSPKKDENNGYRVYSREDFICMDYIMRLRKMNMPLEDIRELVNNSSIERAEAVMQVQERIVEEKIAELKNLQIMVNDYQKTFSNVIQNMGKITVEESPIIIYKMVEDSTMANVMSEFKRLTGNYNPKFTFMATPEKFSDKEAWGDFLAPELRDNLFRYAITLIDDEMFSERMDLEARGFDIFPAQKCVHAILKAYTSTDYSDFFMCRDYILDRGFKLTGMPMFRMLSVRYYNVSYYDFWAPIA